MSRTSRRLVAAAPHLLTAVRVVLAPALLVLIPAGRAMEGALCLAVVMATDAADGAIARRLGVESRAGALFDVWADFIAVEAAFVAFALTGLGTWWLPGLTALAFAVFVVSTRFTPRMYDPLGRHSGGLLMLAAFGMALASDLAVFNAIMASAIGVLVVTLGGRAVFVASTLQRARFAR